MTTSKITESEIETFAIELFEKLGYQYVYAPDIAPDSQTPARERFEDVLLLERLRSAVARINPNGVLFINGLPLVVIELKNAADENATVKAAYQGVIVNENQ